MRTSLKDLYLEEQCSKRSQELADSYSLEELQDRLDQIYRDMEQEAEPEGGPVSDMYADEIEAYEDAIRLLKGNSGGNMTYDQAIGRAKKEAYGRKTGGNAASNSGKYGGSYGASGEDKGHDSLHEQEDKDQYGRTQADRDWEKGINPKTDKKSTAQNSPSQKSKVEVSIDGEKTDVTINYKPGSDLNNVQISWGEESHTVDFEYEDTYDDHGNEGMDAWFTAESEDGKWKFGLEVYVEASFHNSGNIGDWDWNSLEIEKNKDVEEGTCGYGKNGKIGNKPAGPNMLQERLQKLAGIIK